MVFDHTSYVPVWRWKRGEQHALRNLDESVRPKVFPLIEIPGRVLRRWGVTSPTGLESSVKHCIDSIKKSWGEPASVVTSIIARAHQRVL